MLSFYDIFMMNGNMQSSELTSAARRLRIGAIFSLVLVVGSTLYAGAAWLLGHEPDGAIQVTFGSPGNQQALLVAVVSGALFALGLWRLIGMLGRMEQGERFTGRNIGDLRGFTFYVLISAIVSILLPIALSLIAALSAGAGERRVTFTFDGGDFFALLVSALLFFVVRLLGEAQRLSEEAAQII
jgi:hypothetical protein